MYVCPFAHGMGHPPGLNRHLTDTENFAMRSVNTDVPVDQGNSAGAPRPGVKRTAVV